MSGAGPLKSVAVLISGRGSNMRALLEASRAEPPVYRIDLVIADKPTAAGLALAQRLGVEARALSLDPSAGPEVLGQALAAAIGPLEPSVIALAGFMRILSEEFVDRYAGRILNVHPSLLPKYPGLRTHRSVLAAGDRFHGATVHFVTAHLDAGPPIIQARVDVLPGDDEATLAARVLAQEHRIYPLAVRWHCEGRLVCKEGRPWLDGTPLSAPVLYESGVTENL